MRHVGVNKLKETIVDTLRRQIFPRPSIYEQFWKIRRFQMFTHVPSMFAFSQKSESRLNIAGNCQSHRGMMKGLCETKRRYLFKRKVDGLISKQKRFKMSFIYTKLFLIK